MSEAGRRKGPGIAGRILRRVLSFRHETRDRAAIASSGLFDPAWYRAANPDVAAAGADPLTHYVRAGAIEGRRPSPWFDVEFYLARYADVAAGRQNPLAHYVLYGGREAREPNPMFQARWYLASNPEAAAAVTPLSHYLAAGAAALRDPSPDFDSAWYVERNPDVAQSGLDPLGHYLLVGLKEGRRPSPYGGLIAAGQDVVRTRIDIFKALQPVKGETVALFAAHAADGALKPNVGPYVTALADCGVKVVLVVAVDAPFTPDAALSARLAGGFVRENRGYDFAAWAHVMRAEPSLFAAETLILANDSLIGPSSVDALKALMARVAADPAEVVAATESREFAWHLQSFFIAFKRRALSSVALQGFFGAVRSLDDKEQVIRAYELRLAQALQAGGLSCTGLIKADDAANPTLAHWREMIAGGFPFVKTITLRRGEGEGGDSPWRADLAAEGFDVGVAEATIAAPVNPSVLPARGWPLLRPPSRAAVATRPWKVAFLGPWNFASGLGEASRGYVSALWRTDVRLNLHPIRRPFHIHARLSPSEPVKDFEGPADLAIIHAQPDAWTLFGEEELEAIARARRRAGLWVWEMGHIPEAWRPNFGKVDAAWAPSRYCADIFAAGGATATAVIPHVVPVGPSPDRAGRAAVLAGLGLEPEARIILYAFDGASYLVRKNPEALVRAFQASGLAESGWRLVLKTKNLMDRPDAGRRLAHMAAADPAVLLIDRSVSHEDLAALFAAADLYASTHRSEGFGLTIAEAMAMGKPVVATDFGGSRDFLDAVCGYPVPARLSRLDEDHGHYTRGGAWGEADETAFAEALRTAAARLDAGDHAIGEAARARIAADLSLEAVAAALKGAIEAMMADAARAGAA